MNQIAPEKAYRIFADLSGSIYHGSVLQIRSRYSPGDFVQVHDGVDVIVYTGFSADRRILVATRRDGRWETHGQFALPPGGDDELVEVIFEDSAIIVHHGDAEIILPSCASLDHISAAAGTGHFEVTVKSAPLRGNVTVFPKLAEASLAKHDDVIFDIGMHNGNDTAYYLAKGFRVVAVEANPMLARSAAARFADAVSSQQLAILNVGISRFRGTATFYVNRHRSEWSSFHPEIASRGDPVDEVIVQTVTSSDLFRTYGVPHYVKIDIEGHDQMVVSEIAGLALKPSYVSFENGDLSLFEMLTEAGYGRFKLLNQRLVPELSYTVNSGNGAAITRRFPFGASGPVPEDIPAPWLPAEDMRDLLKHHHAARAARTGPDVDWFDLHAKLDD